MNWLDWFSDHSSSLECHHAVVHIWLPISVSQ